MSRSENPTPRKRKPPIADIVVALVLIGAVALLVRNVLANMAAAGLAPSYAFLGAEAGFDVSEALIPYSSENSYARVVLVGLLNTIYLAAVSLVLATLVGLGVGLLSVGPSPISRGLARGYVELFRNLPKILVLLVMFVVAVNGLPPVRDALSVGPIHISNRSINLPALEWRAAHGWPLLALAIAGLLAWALSRWADRRAAATGRRPRVAPLLWLLILGAPALVLALLETPLIWSIPTFQGFDYEGGARVSLQFVVMAAMLALYHGAQIGEVVRGGIEAAPKGQWEAAASLGFTRGQALRWIIIPQIVRSVIPPMNNQYVNLIKNTSVSIAIGYSDLMAVANTTIKQTFRPLEMMLLTMVIYLALCVGATSLLNRWNERLRRREAR